MSSEPLTPCAGMGEVMLPDATLREIACAKRRRRHGRWHENSRGVRWRGRYVLPHYMDEADFALSLDGSRRFLMPSEPLTPEEIAEMRVWHPEYPDGCENLDESAGLTNPCTSAATWSSHWCSLCTIRRLLESHEMLRQENERLSALDDTAMWQQAEAGLAVAREALGTAAAMLVEVREGCYIAGGQRTNDAWSNVRRFERAEEAREVLAVALARLSGSEEASDAE